MERRLGADMETGEETNLGEGQEIGVERRLEANLAHREETNLGPR